MAVPGSLRGGRGGDPGILLYGDDVYGEQDDGHFYRDGVELLYQTENCEKSEELRVESGEWRVES